jgi:hypothetical protein
MPMPSQFCRFNHTGMATVLRKVRNTVVARLAVPARLFSHREEAKIVI